MKIRINLDVKECDGNIINRAEVAGNSSFGQAFARNLSTIDGRGLSALPLQKTAVQPAGISCACSEENYNETDDFDPCLCSGSGR